MYSLTAFSSIFDNKTDTRAVFCTFEEFEKSLYHLAALPGFKMKRGERVPAGCKPSPLISPAVYKEGSTRANDNVIEWGRWAAIDVDTHVFNGDLEEELKSKYGEFHYVCYSTSSSTKEMPKFRLVFPLTDVVSRSKIKHFWFALNTEFGNMGDAQTKDLSRMYYVPAQYPNAYNFIFSNIGQHINPDELMDRHQWNEPVTSANFFDRLPPELQKEVINHRQAKMQSSASTVSWTSYKDCPFVSQKLVKEFKDISKTDGSGRYSMIYKLMASIACFAVKRSYPITEYEIVEMIRQLDRETSNRYAKRPLNVEASRAIEYAYKTV